MIQCGAVGNDRRIEMKHVKLQDTWPAITIAVDHDKAEFSLTHGLEDLEPDLQFSHG